MAEDMLSALERNVRESGIRFFDLGSGAAGHRPCDRAGARSDAAGHDDRLRRQSHLDARRVRRPRVRDRHVAGARRSGVAVPGDGAAEGPPHRGQRAPRPGRLCEGRHPANHPPARRPGWRRLRLRVRRRHDRAHDDGRADDDLQHVHRGRRARAGYVNPDEATFDYLRGRRFAPQGDAFDAAVEWWRSMASDPDATLRRRGDDECRGNPTDGDVGDQSRAVRVRRREAAAAGRRSGERSSVGLRGARVHVAAGGRAHQGHEDRRGVRRIVHERAPLGPARGCADGRGPSRSAARAGRSPCRDRNRSVSRPSERGSIACSSRPASTGAAPAARCASR